MNDEEIVSALLAHDNNVTRWFFYNKCRPLLLSLSRRLFNQPAEYDSIVNELYLLLMENDGARLRQFDHRSNLLQWFKVVALHHFLRKRAHGMIEDNNEKSLYEENEDVPDYGDSQRNEAANDVQRLLLMMKNRRQAYVLQRLVLDEADPKTVAEELNVTTDNLYNIKKRAMTAFIQLGLADKHIFTYGKTIR